VSTLESRLASTPFSGSNAAYVEALYERYLADPTSVPADWQRWFAEHGARGDVAHGPVIAELERRGACARRAGVVPAAGGAPSAAELGKQAAVMNLIEAFRLRGHLRANLCPIGFLERPEVPDLDPRSHGLTDADLEREFAVGGMYGVERMKLKDLVARARHTYCDTVGWEFLHCSDFEERRWLSERIEGKRPQWSADQRRALLEHLTAAEGLERYLHTKYVGQKRFSLEGGDALIPLLHETIQQCGAQGVKEIVIGMAHRGRLNVLVNVLGKSPSDLFSEFEGKHGDHHEEDHTGDVKYHMGFSSDVATPGGNVHLALAFNPSHLEIVNPVVEGSVRARQDRRRDAAGKQVVPILIHGDAAFACQGVVMETMQLSLARGFRTGGTLHVVVNNQVGFTTHRPDDARSTRYCTDLGKMFEVPVFHVNGDDPEAVMFVAHLALDYRMRFGKDVIIDLVCYRRHGHNEADEPAATQPTMYKKVRAQKTTRALYAEKLVAAGTLGASDAETMVEAYRAGLDAGRSLAAKRVGDKGDEFTVDWSKYNKPGADAAPFATGVDLQRLRALGAPLTAVPPGFELHPRVAKIVEDRVRMFAGELPLDWGAAETLAYATLLSEGFGIRLCGQDAGRGTFFHRHAVWHEQKTGTTHVALMSRGQTIIPMINDFLDAKPAKQ
jgi:2-oxoglutarate dehydrogenase E1 component